MLSRIIEELPEFLGYYNLIFLGQALLGRDDVHWSFFFDSDASHLEGNDLEDVGDGSFRSVAWA